MDRPDATRVLSARQLRDRSRSSTVLLAAGLALIIIAAVAATWFLNQIDGDDAVSDSQFLLPPASAASAGADSNPPANSVQRPAMASPTSPPPNPAPPAVRTAAPDTAWFETPAVEDAGTDAIGSDEAPATEAIRFIRNSATNPLFPKLRDAWTAYQAADFGRAEALYREVLRRRTRERGRAARARRTRGPKRSH